MNLTKLGDKGGFTLIEVVIAMTILTIALLGLISVTTIVIKGNSFSKMMTTATTLARDKMEQLKRTDIASLAGGSETVASDYTRSWTVNNSTPASGMTTLVVVVQWNWQGAARNVTLRSIVAQ